MRLKWTNSSSVLGIAVGERSIAVAELAPPTQPGAREPNGRWQVRKVAEFTPPGPDQGTATVGDALAQFLNDNGFTATRAAVGVPAKWLVSREKEVPPAPPAQAIEVLRLQAERSFSSELGDLTYDYAGRTDTALARNVLLLALPRRQLDRVMAIAQAAGLEVVSVLPTTLALTVSGEGSAAPDGLLLNVTSDAVELAGCAGGNPRLLRHLSVRGPDLTSNNGTRAGAVAALAGELKRVVAMTPGGKAQPLALWDGVGLSPDDASALGRSVGIDVQPRGGDLSVLRVKPATGGSTQELARYAPAVAVALAATPAAPPAEEVVNFLRPKLAEAKKRRFGRREIWAAVLAGTIVLALLVLWFDLHGKRSALAGIRSQLDSMGPDLKSARETADRIDAARGWFTGRPPALGCLRDVTMAFPDAEPVYVTSFGFGEDRKVRLSGKAPDQRSVLALMEKLRGSGKFADLRLGESRAAGGTSREYTFSMTFTYTGLE